jgi:prolipoprotein diacylglyceryltransferase
MHPDLVEFGPISIRFYGLMYVIRILLAMLMLRREAKRKGLPLTARSWQWSSAVM